MTPDLADRTLRHRQPQQAVRRRPAGRHQPLRRGRRPSRDRRVQPWTVGYRNPALHQGHLLPRGPVPRPYPLRTPCAGLAPEPRDQRATPERPYRHHRSHPPGRTPHDQAIHDSRPYRMMLKRPCAGATSVTPMNAAIATIRVLKAFKADPLRPATVSRMAGGFQAGLNSVSSQRESQGAGWVRPGLVKLKDHPDVSMDTIVRTTQQVKTSILNPLSRRERLSRLVTVIPHVDISLVPAIIAALVNGVVGLRVIARRAGHPNGAGETTCAAGFVGCRSRGFGEHDQPGRRNSGSHSECNWSTQFALLTLSGTVFDAAGGLRLPSTVRRRWITSAGTRLVRVRRRAEGRTDAQLREGNEASCGCLTSGRCCCVGLPVQIAAGWFLRCV